MFRVGQKAECIKTTSLGSVKKGQVVTVSWVGRPYGILSLRFREVEPAQGRVFFIADCFKPLELDHEFVEEVIKNITPIKHETTN